MIKPTKKTSDTFTPYSSDVDLWFEFSCGQKVPISQVGRGRAFVKELNVDMGSEARLCISIDGDIKHKDVVISQNDDSGYWVNYQAIDQLPF